MFVEIYRVHKVTSLMSEDNAMSSEHKLQKAYKNKKLPLAHGLRSLRTQLSRSFFGMKHVPAFLHASVNFRESLGK